MSLDISNSKSSNFEKQVIWSFLLSLRSRNLKENINPKCDTSILPTEDISNNFEKFSQLVGNNDSEDVAKDGLTQKDLNEASKMFITLNSCPSFWEKLYFNAIYGPNSRMSVLASNVVKKSKDDFKVKARKFCVDFLCGG